MTNLFQNLTIAGMPLLLVVLGLVQWFKQLGLRGTLVLNLVSMLIGLLLGVGYQLSLSMPGDFAGWFSTVVFGLGLGLVASGVFDVLNPKMPSG
jgi:hypothetical protein